jgi:hypothetical protein
LNTAEEGSVEIKQWQKEAKEIKAEVERTDESENEAVGGRSQVKRGGRAACIRWPCTQLQTLSCVFQQGSFLHSFR